MFIEIKLKVFLFNSMKRNKHTQRQTKSCKHILEVGRESVYIQNI
jgi:hypothetical protein